ncbi:amino acid adenylation domain-containing protein [Streptomyces mobaraensis NBRC 13819 = DSM 40847]|uniref:Non-ribosomal peptide synthetase n=2 Tax=Streptomyces mobaraensis TaxID=35621 RepID=M3A8B2_STRM1|nr:non-ribosomal peptide synthetase [Streptomyces mobaraensis NBRC 13819 = DSM 40847]QTT72612.1 amino acid adenylation domain-containing protein [Streptomyces mobaraensis NBRC 13819 = DSM 40847]
MNMTDHQAPLLHERVARQAAATPDAEAVAAGRERLTYRELEESAEALAAHLRRLGAGPETPVGVCLGRTPWLVVAVLGVLKAGAAYVPLDPAFPADRMEFMLRDSGARLVVTEDAYRGRLAGAPGTVVSLDRDWSRIAAEDPAPAAGPEAGNLAYVLYTSGSTGRPKGVAVEHRSAAAFLDWALTEFTPRELRYTLASTSLCFDLSVFELFTPLACGGTVVLAETVFHLPVAAARRPVTLVNSVPSLLLDLLASGPLPASVLTVNLAGEALPATLAQKLYGTGTVERVHNLYGPTEDTTYSTWSRVPRGCAKPLIGRPVTGTAAYVLDATGRPVPDGEAGELFLAGAGLARGYLHRPGLTAERFLPDPFSGEPGARMYRTGDLARRLPSGELDYLGRADQQVKVRGLRIEPGEIEGVLLERPEIRRAAVVARGGGADTAGLVAYVECDGAPDPAILRKHLGDRLPSYMVPSVFVPMASLPLTVTGKIDVNALPVPPG